MNIHNIAENDSFEGKIRPINIETDAQNLADFFNEIDDLWPGTWTEGMKYTAKRAKEFIEKRNALKTYVAFNPENKLVGFCSIHKRMEEENVSYIAILSAHPTVLSKKYGKHLLLNAVDFSVKNGDRRQDLNTWPSNMKAVPLYKKIGLQWVPDTSVYMQNYLPQILQHPLCLPFFEKYPNWYLNMKRELSQAPDEEKLGNMNIFEYQFEEDGNLLTVVIDRYSRSIVGITRIIEGNQVSVQIKQEDHEVFTGHTKPLSILVDDNSNQSFDIDIKLKSSEELLVESSQSSLSNIKGKKTIPFEYKILDSTHDTKIYRKTPSILANIKMGAKEFQLETGLRAKQPIEISEVTTNRWFPTGNQIVNLNIQNRTKEDIKGKLTIRTDSDIEIINNLIEVYIGPEEFTGVSINLIIPKSIPQPFNTLLCQIEMNNSLKSRIFEIPIFVSDNPSVAAGIQQDRKRVIIQNQKLRGIINLEGANFSLEADEQYSGLGGNILDFGPPFGFSEFNQVEFSPRIESVNGSARVIVLKVSKSKEYLTFERIYELQSGANHVIIWENIKNSSNHNDKITIPYRPYFTNGINIPMGTKHLVFDDTPLEGPNFLWMTREGELPDEPEKYEPWISITAENYSYYHIFENINTKANLSKGILANLEKEVSIAAFSESESDKSYLGICKDTWIDIRELAYHLVKNEVIPHEKLVEKPKYYINVDISQDDLILSKRENTLNLTLSALTTQPISGRVLLRSSKNLDINPKEIDFQELSIFNDNKITFTVINNGTMEFSTSNLQIIIENQFYSSKTELPLLIFNEKTKPEFFEYDPQNNKKLVGLKNDLLEIKSSQDVAGTLTAAIYKGENFIKSNYPEMPPSIFFSRDPGGFMSLLLGPEDNLEDLKSLNEKYEYSEIINGKWYGTQYSTKVNERKSLKGLIFTVTYEIMSGNAKIIRIRTSIHNPTDATHKFAVISFLNPGIDNKIDDISSEYNTKGKFKHKLFRTNPQPIIALGGRYLESVQYSKDDQNITMFCPENKVHANLFPFDAGPMILGGGVFSRWYLKPQQKEEFSFYLVPDASSTDITVLKTLFEIEN